MTYPRDYREMSKPAIQNDIRTMNSSRLQNMMNYVGPEINPRAKTIIEEEIEQRNYEQMAAAANQTLNHGDSFSTLNESGVFSDDQVLPPVQNPPESQNAVYSGGPEEVGQSKHMGDSPTPQSLDKEPSSEQQVFEIIIGALILEALLMEEVAMNLHNICEVTDEIQVLSKRTIDKLLEHLWTECSPEGRSRYIASILNPDEQEIASVIKELAREAELSFETF